MNGFPWEFVFAVFGLTVPVVAAVWEFLLAGRKRLGYRVQMDTTATDAATSLDAGALAQLHHGGETLRDPSFALLRIENGGWQPIVGSDYVGQNQHGIEVTFPGREVAGMVVTELSDNLPRAAFRPSADTDDGGGGEPHRIPGLGFSGDTIRLPRVTLNRGAHYKVLAVLKRTAGADGTRFTDPVVDAVVVGGVRGGRIRRTEYHPFASKPIRALLAVLVVLSIGQSLFTFFTGDEEAAPLDCTKGTLTLSGSTAFAPVLREAAKQYEKTCPDARIPITADTFKGSVAGLNSLAAAGGKADLKDSKGLGDRLAFSDGPKSEGRPQLLPRPVALSLFTLVVNKDTGVQDLSLEQVREIYAGRITNWLEVKGNDVPIHLVSRNPGSGTRTTLQQQVLDDKPLLAVTANDCTSLADDRPGRCEVGDTDTLLDTVATTTGALGHSDVGAAATRDDVQQVRIDGYPATLEGADEGAYPYWQTEIAYTYGEPPADSMAAGFLRYLSNEVGKDILRSSGHRPCAELDKPLLCRPSQESDN